jgi:hypothetical protein
LVDPFLAEFYTVFVAFSINFAHFAQHLQRLKVEYAFDLTVSLLQEQVLVDSLFFVTVTAL